tara:strand:- start:2124 stop:3545 length:1422 start_codon:yes stop_codon:yes gene_type:complete
MNSNIIQKKSNFSNGISFIAKVYRINKGPNAQNSYFATLKKKVYEELKIKEKDAILLEIQNKSFPTVVRKLKTSKNRFMLGFTVPYKISNKLPLKTDINFKFLKKTIENKNIPELPDNINLLKIIPTRTIRNSPIYIFDLNDKILIWIYSGGNKPYILPKYIPINYDMYNLFEVGGFFFCEGFKARKIKKHRDRFSLSNSDKEQIDWFLNAVEKLLNIPKSKWKTQILFPTLKENKNLIDFWSNLGLREDSIKVHRNETAKSQHGVCILNIFNSTLAETTYHLMQYITKQSLTSKKNALNFFRGLSRGDMGVSKTRTFIDFSTESKENAFFFKKLCKILEIPIQTIYNDERGIKGYWKAHIAISHDTLLKLIKLNAITHSQRKHSLYKMTMNHKKLILYLYLNSINCGSNTSKSSAKFLNLSQITTRLYLQKLSQQGYFTRLYKDKHYIYSLTDKGTQTLKFYNEIEKQVTNQ